MMSSERSSMLRRQRESALRKRQNHAPISRNNSTGSEASYRSTTLDAMADVNAFEETRTREKIEIRMRDEEIQREEESRMRIEMAKAAEIEAECLRYEHEQEELKRRLAEQRAREEAERQRYEQEQMELKLRLEEERRLADARRVEEEEKAKKLEMERLAEARRIAEETERMERERRAELERLEYELKRERLERERERLAMEERLKIEARQVGAPIEEDNVDGNNEQLSRDNSTGSNNGYRRYLSTYHQPESAEDPEVESNANQNEDSGRGSKIKRTTSSRSLSFDEANPPNSSKPSSRVSGEEKERLEGVVSRPTGGKTSSLQQATSIESVNLDDPEATRSFLMQPCPKEEGTIECCIRRNKGIKNALFPEYRMYLKSNNSKTETFLMTSKKRAGSKTSNYLISMSRNDHDKNSDSVLGKLRSNFLGTEYSIFDNGVNPAYDESFYDEKNDGETRCELGAILYATNTSLGSKGPRKMKVCIGKTDDDGNPLRVWQPTNKEDERMVTCFKKETANIDKLLCLENTPPKWNEEVGAYVLNFHGRVTQSSVKNFQLCDQSEEQKQIMQFGRTGKDEFSLDVQWPMSPFQAFAVALSSFDSKLGCD